MGETLIRLGTRPNSRVSVPHRYLINGCLYGAILYHWMVSITLGRIGKKWEHAVQVYRKKAKKTLYYIVWSTQVVLFLWKYTRSLWGARNEYVHRKDAKEQAEIILRRLHAQVIQHYEQYRNNSNIVLPQHAYLFTS